MSQLDFLKQVLRLDSESDHEIEINNDQATGVIYLAIGDDDAWLGLNFTADIEHPYESICRGHWYSRVYDYTRIENVANLTVSFADSCDGEGNLLNIDYTARIDEIKAIITAFIESAELEAPDHYNTYAA